MKTFKHTVTGEQVQTADEGVISIMTASPSWAEEKPTSKPKSAATKKEE